MSTPDRPGWYPDPLKPATQERRWDGTEWTEETREASVPVAALPSEPVAPDAADLVEADEPDEPDGPSEPIEQAAPASGVQATAPDDHSPPVRRATMILVAVVVLLVGVLALQVAYLWGPLQEDATVSSARPVLLDQAAERSAVDTAATAAVAFSARSFETYDEQVDAAASMMTDDFAKEFRQTTDDARAKFVEAQAQVTAEVAAQAVMTASERQVEVLIFLNQFTTKVDEDSVFTPFRLKVTLIDTEQGWLVSDVDAA